MKVSAKKEEFRPIHIILETEAEAELMWYMLNAPSCYLWGNYCGAMEESRFNKIRGPSVKYDMFNSFDNAFDIRKLKKC